MLSKITLTLILVSVAITVMLAFNVTGQTSVTGLDCASKSTPVGDYTLVYCIYDGTDNQKLLHCCTTSVETPNLKVLSYPIHEDTAWQSHLLEYTALVSAEALKIFEKLLLENHMLRNQLKEMKSNEEMKKE